ncbi:MAG: hypothetical protein ACFFAN_13590 [Promethearchaeota archaeon]
MIFKVSRIIIIFSEQPRFNLPYNLNLLIKIPFFIFGVIINEIAEIKLKKSGFLGTSSDEQFFMSRIFGIVTHPVYLAEII